MKERKQLEKKRGRRKEENKKGTQESHCLLKRKLEFFFPFGRIFGAICAGWTLAANRIELLFFIIFNSIN